MSKKTEDVKKTETPEEKAPATQLPAVPTAALPAEVPVGLDMDDIAADAGRGTENMSAADLATPLIYLLQANSPQCKRSDSRYIAGATEGDLYNNVTNEVTKGDAGLLVLPCYWEKVFIEWKPARGGLVAVHNADTPLRQQVVMKEVKDEQGNVKQVPTLPNGNTLSETNQHYVLLIKPDGSYEPAVISMSSSQLKSSRLWNSLIKKVVRKDNKGRLFNPASYYCMYKVSTKSKQKDQYSWFVFDVSPAGVVPTRELYEAGKAFEQAVAKGTVRVKHDEAAADEAPAAAREPGQDTDDVPFD